jgi:hypothetical protein
MVTAAGTSGHWQQESAKVQSQVRWSVLWPHACLVPWFLAPVLPCSVRPHVRTPFLVFLLWVVLHFLPSGPASDLLCAKLRSSLCARRGVLSSVRRCNCCSCSARRTTTSATTLAIRPYFRLPRCPTSQRPLPVPARVYRTQRSPRAHSRATAAHSTCVRAAPRSADSGTATYCAALQTSPQQRLPPACPPGTGRSMQIQS